MNSTEPAKIVMLMNIGYQKLNPETFIYIPYVRPRNQNPANIGIVYGKAHFKALITVCLLFLKFEESSICSIKYLLYLSCISSISLIYFSCI